MGVLLLLVALLPLVASTACGPALPHASGGFKVEKDKVTAEPRKLECRLMDSEGALPSQCCCSSEQNSSFIRCLPQAIIAGAQKSGSTALFGYFLMHPQFNVPQRKELHSFDNSNRWRREPIPALQAYLSSFKEYNPKKVKDLFWRCRDRVFSIFCNFPWDL